MQEVQTVSDRSRREAGLSVEELWLRYFSLGGMATPSDVKGYLLGSELESCHEHDMLAHALNERFSELGRNHPVAYCGADR